VSPAPTPSASYASPRRRQLEHTHCPHCGAPERPRRVIDVTGPRRQHSCAFSDMVECPGCLRPIVRRLPDGAPLDINLRPHRCPTAPEDDDEAAHWLAAVERGYWSGAPARWAAHQQEVRRQIEAQNVEDERLEAQRWAATDAAAEARDLEASHYADWVAFRTANGIPDAGEAGLPEARP